MSFQRLVILFWVSGTVAALGALTPDQIKQLPAPANHKIDFATEIKPIFEASCINCHGHGRNKGGLKIDTRETLMRGSDDGPVIVPGKSEKSLLIEVVQGFDPDEVMPKKGTRLTPTQIGLLRAWIDQGAPWDENITFARPQPLNLIPRQVEPPADSAAANPIDKFLDAYYATNKFTPPQVVSDRVFARRAFLDVLGLLPSPADLKKFNSSKDPDKRAKLVSALLSRNEDYAQNWLTFWNDMLRNDYKGTGYIDGGRKQITKWLYSSLLTNKPFNEFVAELIDPVPGSEGFTKGIVWRGAVSASQAPTMQAAQSICQVFMGVNLKCASCHDSFINDLTLSDAYGLAGIYADGRLEMVHCDKPTGQFADLKFIYPELGKIDPKADKPTRLKELASIITEPKDGRLTSTFVNRLWQRFFGRGLVEPVDEMDKPAWDPDVLEWLANDFTAHHYDVKHLISVMLTSRAYQLPAVSASDTGKSYVFQGPLVRRMTAEQFRDALTELTGYGYPAPAADIADGRSSKKRIAWSVPVHWIWDDPQANIKTTPGHVYFRKTVNLKSIPSDAKAVVVCDNSFTLFVNGRKVGAGNDSTAATILDLHGVFQAGNNIIAVEAVNNLRDNSAPGAVVPSGQENPAGLLVYLRLRGAKGHSFDTGSDATWLASIKPGEDWKAAENPSGDWKAASDLGDLGMQPWRISKGRVQAKLAALYPGTTRASLVAADPLMTALGRPNREQVVTTRPTDSTTLEALELTNGQTLADILSNGAKGIMASNHASAEEVIATLYLKAVGRLPSADESKVARELLGQPMQAAGVEDLLWAVTMLPEFQLIY